MKALLLCVAAMLLVAAPVHAQPHQHHWLSGLGRLFGLKPRPTPTPPMMIPRLPLQAAPGIRVYAPLPLEHDLRLLGAFAPMWINDQEVAILAMRQEHVVLVAFGGDRFQTPSVLLEMPRAQLLNMALSPDRHTLATVATSGDQLTIALRATAGPSPPTPIAVIPGAYRRASLAWLDRDTLAVGVSGAKASSEDAGQSPAESLPPALYLVSAVPEAREPQTLDLECLDDIDPARARWSPDGNLALAPAVNGASWYLLDRSGKRCDALRLKQLVPVDLLQWAPDSRRFMFTAVPARIPAPYALGVVEYDIRSAQATILAAPAGAAVYLGKLGEAVLGSRGITAQSLRTNPGMLAAAEVGWFTSTHAQLKIVPLGVQVQGGALLAAGMLYSDAAGLLAIRLEAPGGGGDFPALLWLSVSLRTGGVLAYGETHGFLAAGWSPDGSKIAVIGGPLDAPAAAILESPHQ